MSSVIERHELRVSPGFDTGWDGPKRFRPNLDCVWKLMVDGRATLHILPSNNPVFCGHYQYSKHDIADTLSKTDQEAILRADSFM
jgi:hypothetical protein